MQSLMNLSRLTGRLKLGKCSSAIRYYSQQPNSDLLESATIRPELLSEKVSHEFDLLGNFDPEPHIEMQKMFNAGVWHGHKIGTLRDNMKWALYGKRLDTCIFDLNITQQYMRRAMMFLAHAVYKGSIVLFISSNRETMHTVERMATEIGEYAHTRKWENSTLTNIKQLFDSPLRLPDVIIFLTVLSSTMTQHPAIIEAAKMAIPTIGIVDSNAEPNYITYPIPGSDDSERTVEFYMNAFCRTIEFAKDARKKQMEMSQSED